MNKEALQKLIELEKETRSFGFDWPNVGMIIDQVIDECREIREAIDKNEDAERVQEEIGDLLHSAISLCLFCGFDPEETFTKVNLKFSKRMAAVKAMTFALDLENLHGQSLEFMLDLWRKAKEKE